MIQSFGCTATHNISASKPIYGKPAATSTTGSPSWWNCRFKIFWPPDQDLDLTMDLFLAHAVVSPVIDEFIEQIHYWRFHRRAARDAAGHQFSFMFYASPHTADQIFGQIQQNDLLKKAIQARIVEKVMVDNPQRPSRPEVQAKSDRNWSPAMQKNWPYFIMGVSSLWLGLIKETAAGKIAKEDDIQSLIDCYRQIDNQVTTIWYQEGQHALLHHLNAVFGYSPLLIKKQMRF
jgi:hypothetical protein